MAETASKSIGDAIRSIGAQVPQVHNSPKDILENLLPVWLSVRPSRF